MSGVKRCVQCGILKEQSEFRKYTYSKENNTEGHFRTCKSCEAINSAYRRAKQWREEHNPIERKYEIDGTADRVDTIILKTERLYATLEARGLRVPTAQAIKTEDAFSTIDSLLDFYKEDVTPTSAATIPAALPDELKYWLEADTDEWVKKGMSPEYLQETVYESLKAKYRPQIGVNKETYLPIYDDTFKIALNSILRRFDDWEELYCDSSGDT